MPFGQFFRNRLIGWIGHALLVQPSKTAHRIFFSFIFDFSFIFLNMKPLSEVASCLLVIQIQIQAVWLVCIGLHVAFFLVFILLHHSLSLLRGSGVSKNLRGPQDCLFLPQFSFLYLQYGSMGCWVFKQGIQNKKKICPKPTYPKEIIKFWELV